MQHISYESQLKMKKQQVVNLFHKKAKLEGTVIYNTIGMDYPWRYRNKSRLPVGKGKNNKTIMGYYRQRSHDITDMDSCLVQDEKQQELMDDIKQWLNKLSVSIYNEKNKKGLLRHVVIRTSHYTSEVMIIFITNDSKFKETETLVHRLAEVCPSITSIEQNISNSYSNVIMGEQSMTLYGKDKIADQLSKTILEIDDQSFYQIDSV